MTDDRPRIGILMGSDSDWPVMESAAGMCDELGVRSEVRVLSAHRTPHDAAEYATSARERGVEVVIAGAGGAAHLAGVLASHTMLPVIGVPIGSSQLKGLDALLATVQMPRGIPVATVGVDRADNAALLALRILALQDVELERRLEDYRKRMAERVRAADQRLQRERESGA